MLGDHIRALIGGTWLHGIDLGDQRILYLAEAPGLAPGDRLRRVYRPEFTAGARRVELVVHREPAYPAKAVVARAWSRFMDPSVVAMFKDSEAFAAWCKIGRLPEASPAAPAPRAAASAPKAPPASKAAKPAAPKAKAAAKAPARKAVAAKAAPKKRQAPARTKAASAKPAARKAARPAARKAAKRAPAKKKGRRS